MSIFEEDDKGSEDTIKIPSCLSFFNEWRLCNTSHRQFRHYYIYGKLSQCEQEQSNWTNCLSWRTTKDKEARASILEYLKKKEEEMNKKHSAVVWKFRRDPAKDWNET